MSETDHVVEPGHTLREPGLGLDSIDKQANIVEQIPVHISYEIIKLFSEGLYQSPQKAVEELVSNGYDAEATDVHVLLPDGNSQVGDNAGSPAEALWVIDNGHGMDASGFAQLWRVAGSSKAKVDTGNRLPIGQFGIGKLAAYVLAWRLTHISKVNGKIFLTSMNFRRLEGKHQYDSTQPLDLDLMEITVDRAEHLLESIRYRDSAAWETLFGSSASKSWTVAALSDFKDLYEKLSHARLTWVLRTGLPLHSEFHVWLNGVELTSSKIDFKVIKEYVSGGEDVVADSLAIRVGDNYVEIPGIEGRIFCHARIFERRLTESKAEKQNRSNGFFVKVRQRVINLDDELFGLSALNHAAWSRFSMEVSADGLREHLLSSREGVRGSTAIDILRKYMHGVFNQCRRAYEEWATKEVMGIDVARLLSDAPSVFVTEPIVEGVRNVIRNQEESYYVSVPDLEEQQDLEVWLENFQVDVSRAPFTEVKFESTGPYDRVIRYLPDTRALIVNKDHPFINKLLAAGSTNAPAALFGSSELLVDLLMQEHGFASSAIADFLVDRDRVLRLVAGEEPSTAAEVLRLLQNAIEHETALERAVGATFRVLGFEYDRRGGNSGGPDGVLFARLGSGESVSDYKIVYDSKQSNKPAVPADKIDISSLEDFRVHERADYGFFLAVAYAGEQDVESKLNRKVGAAAREGKRITLLRVSDLRRLVEFHYKYGVTLTRLRSLFAQAHTVAEVESWLDELEDELTQQEPQVPLITLLQALERAKEDRKAVPNVYTARMLDQSLMQFSPEKLTASLFAVETIIGKRWIEAEKAGDVILHHTADQIVTEVERHLRNLFGADPIYRTNKGN